MLYAAIKKAAGDASMSDGLRAVRRFEKVNGIAFDPALKSHMDKVRNCGEDERFFRRAKKVLCE